MADWWARMSGTRRTRESQPRGKGPRRCHSGAARRTMATRPRAGSRQTPSAAAIRPSATPFSRALRAVRDRWGADAVGPGFGRANTREPAGTARCVCCQAGQIDAVARRDHDRAGFLRIAVRPHFAPSLPTNPASVDGRFGNYTVGRPHLVPRSPPTPCRWTLVPQITIDVT